jgi:hypothetical protein
LSKETPEASGVACDIGIYRAVRAFEIHVRDKCRSAVTGTREVNDIGAAVGDQPIQVYIKKAQAG